ncbi:branched-chain alpha-keto acid dehydrogenase E2 subunit [Streptococcus pneumoniae]|uniref:lipoyl domain-containing protein n=1 Tax=Stutzerimonas stutzeri TaxID=316 RepID=UPI0005E7F257|nr:lipoyl domain-containing protein [Stutzerimonas stutzeri]CJL60818.1 branched-chain alpha-keto acid dehydrogenase E2 subunit [Streptococcus pneumoniae]RRV87400.1 biotin attachment protein [Stutzerimonas stutzeri]RRV95690.1 biotin attachment protein [Stutzerimonas stutzeri]RRV97805.1 biotin attachment protein [Stutzerimonas stutzeri]RRW01889.1 biotin attachment protein [Stutzerimonas stutzeri]
MSTPIVIADDLWEGDAEAVITSWLVSDGAEVAAGDLVAEVMSEKAQFEIEAPAAGVLKIIVEEDAVIAKGAVIGQVE